MFMCKDKYVYAINILSFMLNWGRKSYSAIR